MYDLGCMWIVYRDPSWYSTNYRVYMGSSMTVRPLADCHCTCAIINWSVLRQLALEQDSTLIATCVFKTKIFVFQNQFLATNSYINRYLKPRIDGALRMIRVSIFSNDLMPQGVAGADIYRPECPT